MEGLAVGQHRVAVEVGDSLVQGAVRRALVGLARQAEGIVQEALFSSQRGAAHGQRPADLVHPLLESREHQRVAAVDEVVVDRLQRDRLRHVPVIRREHQLLPDRRRAGAVGRNGHGRGDLARLVGGGVGDGQHAAALLEIEGGVEAVLFRQLGREHPRHGGEVVTEGGLVVHGEGGAVGLLELERPDLALRDKASQLDLDLIRVVLVVGLAQCRQAGEAAAGVRGDGEGGEEAGIVCYRRDGQGSAVLYHRENAGVVGRYVGRQACSDAGRRLAVRRTVEDR